MSAFRHLILCLSSPLNRFIGTEITRFAVLKSTDVVETTTCTGDYISNAIFSMTKATRFLTIAIPAVFLYFLALLQILPIPLLSPETSDAILPVVSQFHSIPS